MIFVALSVFAVTGCVHRAECKLHGGPEWHVLTSPHFEMRTDAELDDARGALERMEQLRGVLFDFCGGQAEAPSKLTILYFRDRDEIDDLRSTDRAYMNSYARRMVLGPDFFTTAGWRVGSVLVHELTHDVAHHALLRMPRWLNEGLAQYLATAHLEKNGTQVAVGMQDSSALYGVTMHNRFPVSELWDFSGPLWKEEDAEREGTFYSSSWLLVHFLVNRHYTELATWFDHLRRAEDPRSSFEAIFGKDSQKLEKELDDYLSDGHYSAFHYDVNLSPVPITVKELPPSLVHLARFELGWDAVESDLPRSPEKVADDATKAIQLGHDVFEAREFQFQLTLGRDARLQSARTLAAEFPNEAQAHFLLAKQLKTQGPTRDEALRELRKVLELNPRHASALNAIAWDMVTHGEGAKAVGMAQTAVEVEPWNANIVDTLASAMAAAGRCSDASATEHRALELLGHDASRTNQDFAKRAELFSRPDCASHVPQAETTVAAQGN
ncbi:MAG: DUF1570 domain-containing protein [Myxococcaceae bacterium]